MTTGPKKGPKKFILYFLFYSSRFTWACKTFTWACKLFLFEHSKVVCAPREPKPLLTAAYLHGDKVNDTDSLHAVENPVPISS